MKLAILRFVVVALACACALIVITSPRAQKVSANQDRFAPLYSALGMPQPEQTPAATQEKTIAQEGREKNVKLLGDLPVSQFIPVMNYFAASLGRRCNFCHVNNNGQWDYASDAKPEKNTAREMIKMTLDIHTKNFPGASEISCYTCHRGQNNPVNLPPLPLPTPVPRPSPAATSTPRPGGFPQPEFNYETTTGGVTTPPRGFPSAAAASQSGYGTPTTTSAAPSPATRANQTSPSSQATPTPALPSADEIFNKYIVAVGGQAKVDSVKSRTLKGTTTQATGNPIPFEVEQAAPDKFHIVATLQQGTAERGYNGTVGWDKTPNGVRELSAWDLLRLQASLDFLRNLRLKDQFTSTRVRPSQKINDRPVVMVIGTTKAGTQERLYFDTETGFLLRRIAYLSTMLGLIPDQVDFDDYRDVDGLKLPFTIRVASVDMGNPLSTRTFTEMKLNATIDESKFNMPPTPPAPVRTPTP